MASNKFEQRAIDPRQKNYYELKKVGKHWIIKAGGKVKHLQFANNARDVYLDENIIAVDDILFEIKEDSSGDIFTERISSLVCQPGLDDKNQTKTVNQAEKYEIEQNTGIFDIGSGDLDKGNEEYDSLEAGQTEVDSIIERYNINAAKMSSKDSRIHSPSIHIVEGSLDKMKADALACIVSPDMDLSRGAVSAALLKRGGRKLQGDLDEKYCGRLPFGEIVAVPGYTLDCRFVVFGVMYPFEKEYAKGYTSLEHYYRANVHEFVQKCLNLAEEKKLRTIAFPAVGAGILRYPTDIVADQMFETVINWRGVYVKKVTFVIYQSDKYVLKEFHLAEKQHGKNRDSASGMKSSLNSVSTSGISSHSGQTSLWTSEFTMDNPNGHSAQSKFKCIFPIPEGYTAEFIQICCEDTIDTLKNYECDISFTKDAVVVKAPPDVIEISKIRLRDALLDMRKEYPPWQTLDLTHFNQSDVMRKVEEIKESLNVKCVINKMKTKVDFFGKKMQVKEAKDRVVSLLLPPRN